MLTSVNRPIYAMLNRWIYHGELEVGGPVCCRCAAVCCDGAV